MATMTLRGQTMTERILERREQYFCSIDTMTDEQVDRVSKKWHAVANRYMALVARITVRSMDARIN